MTAKQHHPPLEASRRFTRRCWAVLFAGLAALGLFYHRPQWQRYRQRQQELLQLQQQVQELRQENGRLPQVQQQLDQTRRFLDRQHECRLLVPAEELVARCVSVFSDAQVQIRQFRRRELRKRPALQEIWIEVECQGKLPRVFRAVALLEQLSQPVWIENLRLAPAGEESPEVQCRLLLRGFAGNLQESG